MQEVLNYIKTFPPALYYVDSYEETLSISIGDRTDSMYLCYFFDPSALGDSWVDEDWEQERIIQAIFEGQIQIKFYSVRFWSEYETVENFRSSANTHVNKLESIRLSALKLYIKLFNNIPEVKIGYADDSYCSGSVEAKYLELVFKHSEHHLLIKYCEYVTNSDLIIVSPATPFSFLKNPIVKETTHNIHFIPFITTNTKARRIGYWKIIIKLFEKGSYYPLNLLPIKVESLAAALKPELKEYKSVYKGDDKGEITEGFKGASAKPYIQLTKELNLLTEINKSYILTKQAKPYLEINRSFDESDNNKFVLNNNDKLFFLQTIIGTDILYFGTISELALIAGDEFHPKKLYPLFKRYLIHKIDLMLLETENDRREGMLQEMKKRVLQWENEIKYVEHIIEPRINWLLDLQLIKHSNNKGFFCFSDAGRRFVNVLCGISENYIKGWLDVPIFLNEEYYLAVNYIYDWGGVDRWDANAILKYLEEAMVLFKTDAPRRIAASQGINYVCTKSLLEKGFVVSFSDVKSYLINLSNSHFALDWYKTENDGSLIKQT